MALTEWLLPIALLALCWGPSLAGAQGTIPMQTLRCYNDYANRTICRWADTRDAQRLVNVTLHHRLNEDPLQPVSCDLTDDMPWSDCPSPRCVPRRCVIPQEFFVIGDRDYFSFQPDRPLDTQLTVTLTQHVQPPAPKDLHISAAGDHFLLTWSAALGGTQSQWLSNLEFEVVYRRLQDSWEDAPTLYSTSTEAILGPKHLLPGRTYVARVRTRLGPGSGLSGRPSQWSPEVRWDSQPGDEAQPQNLQCFFDGGAVLNCSWEVRSEVTSSVFFTLFYESRPSTEGEKECSPVLTEEASGRYVRQRCQIPIPDPRNHSQYIVSVRPKKEERYIKSSANRELPPASYGGCLGTAVFHCVTPINSGFPMGQSSRLSLSTERSPVNKVNKFQMAQPTLNVTKNGDDYIMHWKIERLPYKHIEYTYEVQYKKDEALWEESKTESLQNTHIMSLPPLEPSTRYQARVRVKPYSGYDGMWSEWSEEHSWVTEWVLPMWVLALILVFTTLALLPALRFCGMYGYRLNRKWEEKIPNPSKSHLFQNGSAGLWLPDSMSALASRSPSHKGPWGSSVPGLEGVSSVDCGHNEVSPLTTEDPKDAHGSPPEADLALAVSDLPTEPPPSPQPCLSASSSRPESQVSGFDFNGPYLGPPLSLSQPDLVGQEAPQQMDMSQKPLPSGSLEYLCLPAGGQVQLVPLAQVMGQGQTMCLEKRPRPGAEGSHSLESGAGPAPPSPGLTVGGQGPKVSPTALSTAPGGPQDSTVASGYVTTADLSFTSPEGAPCASWAPPMGLPSDQKQSLSPGVIGGLPVAPAPMKPEFQGYVDLPPTVDQSPESPLGSLAPLAAMSPTPSPGKPQVDVTPASPHPEGLLVLQQVGDYCFLPGTGSGPLSGQNKSSSPITCPEVRDPGQVFQDKKLPCQAIPQVPAIQLFKALKQQDYLSLPPWDISRPGEVC